MDAAATFAGRHKEIKHTVGLRYQCDYVPSYDKNHPVATGNDVRNAVFYGDGYKNGKSG